MPYKKPISEDVYDAFGEDHAAGDLYVRLLIHANRTDGKVIKVGQRFISLRRGQAVFSARRYGTILRCSPQGASNVLNRLQNLYAKVDVEPGQSCSIVSLRGFDALVNMDAEADASLTQRGHSVDDTEIEKKEKKERKPREPRPVTPGFVPNFPEQMTGEERTMFTGWMEDLIKAKKKKTDYGWQSNVEKYMQLSPVPALRLSFLRAARSKPWESFYGPDLTARTYWIAVQGLTPEQRRLAASGDDMRKWLQTNLPDEYETLFP